MTSGGGCGLVWEPKQLLLSVRVISSPPPGTGTRWHQSSSSTLSSLFAETSISSHTVKETVRCAAFVLLNHQEVQFLHFQIWLKLFCSTATTRNQMFHQKISAALRFNHRLTQLRSESSVMPQLLLLFLPLLLIMILCYSSFLLCSDNHLTGGRRCWLTAEWS